MGVSARVMTPSVRCNLRGEMSIRSSSPGILGEWLSRAVANVDMRVRSSGWWPYRDIRLSISSERRGEENMPTRGSERTM